MYIEIIGSSKHNFRDKKVIIFGAGGRGQKVLREFTQLGADVIAFCDNNVAIQGTLLENRMILSPIQLLNYQDCEVIIASTYHKEIQEQLSSMGIKNIYKIRYGVAEITILPAEFHNSYLSAQEVNNLMLEKLLEPEPFCIARFGSVELECLCQYLKLYEQSEPERIFDSNISYMMENNAGFFPANENNLSNFSSLYIKYLSKIDVMWTMWHSFFENEIYKIHIPRIPVGEFDESSFPVNLKNPWTKALAGKKVLVIHPFVDSMKKNYLKREQLFYDTHFLPEFELLTLKAVQSIAGTKTPYLDWFEALEDMKNKMAKIDFDIVLIGAGAYGLPLAAYAKELGKKAIHVGGPLQLFFGIKGKAYNKLGIYNETWISPSENERPENFKNVEAGRYW